MNRQLVVGALVGLAATVVVFHVRPRAAKAQTDLPHVDSQFDITLDAPYERVAPLFGANGERAWAGKEWDPQFVFPRPAADTSGAVFTVSHGPHTTLWLTPIFDLPNRHIQHVVLAPDFMITLLDIQFQTVPGNKTRVHVHYEHTALSPDASERVRQHGARDQAERVEWESTINQYLGTHR